MEISILAEESHRGGSTPISKSSKPLIKIDSISIDLANKNEKTEVENCEHFSIRGYVSEIRKKDRKICWPFAIDDKHNKSEEQICELPPLQSAKFRWWRCQNCLREIDAQCAVKEIKVVPDPCTSANVNSDNNCVTSCTDKAEKETEFAQTTVTGQENSLKNDANQEFSRPTCNGTIFNPYLKLERPKDKYDPVAPESKCKGFVETSKPNCGINEVTDNGFDIIDLNCQIRKHVSMDDQNKELLTACGMSGVAGVVNESVCADKGHASVHPSLDTHDYASSEGDEILGENNLQDQHHANSGAFHRQKPQKIRLLAELLVAHGSENADNITGDDTPSSASAGTDSLSVSQGQVSIQENVGRGFKGQNKKRKMPHDGEWRPPQTSSPKNENKKNRILKGDVVTTSTATAGSLSDKDASAGTDSHAGKKNHPNNHGVDRNHILKKKIRNYADDECSSLLPLQEVVPRGNQRKIGDADRSNDADTASIQHTFSTGRLMDPPLKSFLSAQRTERKSNLSKKKNKMPQVEKTHTFLMPWNNGIVRESSITRQNVEVKETGPEVVQFQSLQDASVGKEPHLFHENYLAAQHNNRKCTSRTEAQPNLLLPRQKGICREDQVMKKDVGSKYIGESSAPFKSASDAFVEKQVRWDLSIKTPPDGSSLVSEKQTRRPLFEDRNLSMMHKMDSYGKRNGEKAIKVQEHSEVIKKHGDQRAEKVFEQGAIDDIPMEIVELLAKNQYERRLNDAENNLSFLPKTYKPRSGERIDVNKVHADGELKRLHEENPYLQKSQSRTAKKSVFATGETGVPTKQKSIGYFPHLSLQEGTSSSGGFKAFSQCQQKLSSRVQFPGTGSTKRRSAQNCKWDGNMLGNISFPNNLPAFKAYEHDPCLAAPQQSGKASGVWSSIQNRMTYGQNIPQNFPAQSINIDMISQRPGTLQKGKMIGDHDLKFIDLNVADFEKQSGNFGSEHLDPRHGENPYACNKGNEIFPQRLGSVDMYSNETIPAMHLLSLMDAGMPSSTPFNMDGKTKLLNKSSFSHDHQSKELGLDNGIYKASHASRNQTSTSDYYRKNHHSEKSCECVSAVPAFDALASSLQNDISIRKATDFQVPKKSRDKGKAKISYSPTNNTSTKSRKSVSTSVGFGTYFESIPVQSTEKRSFGASDLTGYPSQCRTMKDSSKHIDLEAHSSYESVRPMKRSPLTEMCRVNRNPADFSIPVAGNVYMIGAEDLKCKKRARTGSRSGIISLNRQKKPKINKLAAANELPDN